MNRSMFNKGKRERLMVSCILSAKFSQVNPATYGEERSCRRIKKQPHGSTGCVEGIQLMLAERLETWQITSFQSRLSLLNVEQ